MNKGLIIKLILLFIAFSIFTFGHDYFGRTLAAEWDINDRVQFNQRFNTIALILSPLFIMPFLWGVFKERESWHIKLGYLIFTFSMAWFSYKNLLVVNSEMVHFHWSRIWSFVDRNSISGNVEPKISIFQPPRFNP